jgi:large subunit ribosomal protein L15
MRTHGWGRVAGHRGSGRKGGHGKLRGAFKHHKTLYFNQKAQGFPDPDWATSRGKDGFHRPQKIVRIENVNAINVKDLDLQLDKLVAKGVAEKKGSTYVLDLGKINVQKLLGSGNISKSVEVTVEKAVDRAVEKIESAGGKVVQVAANDDDD